MSAKELRTRIRKIHHACVVIECGSDRMLIDPGEICPEPSFEGIAALLVSHGHFDHSSRAVVAAALEQQVPVWAPEDVIVEYGIEHPLLRSANAGDEFFVGETRVRVAGDRHAEVHPEVQGPMNRAYLIGDAVFVTGDAHPDPPGRVDALVTPIDAPWLRATDLIRYVRQVQPREVFGVHDGLLNALGLQVAQSVAASLKAEGVERSQVLADGEVVEVG